MKSTKVINKNNIEQIIESV